MPHLLLYALLLHASYFVACPVKRPHLLPVSFGFVSAVPSAGSTSQNKKTLIDLVHPSFVGGILGDRVVWLRLACLGWVRCRILPEPLICSLQKFILRHSFASVSLTYFGVGKCRFISTGISSIVVISPFYQFNTKRRAFILTFSFFKYHICKFYYHRIYRLLVCHCA